MKNCLAKTQIDDGKRPDTSGVNTAYQIHYTLGPGLLESVYEEIMYYELCKQGLNVEKQQGIPVIWNELKTE